MIEVGSEVLHFESGNICKVLKITHKGYRLLDFEDESVFEVIPEEIAEIKSDESLDSH